MLYGFAELKRRCGKHRAALVSAMLDKLVEYTHLRQRLGEAALEVSFLERVLRIQAPSFGAKPESVRPDPLLAASEAPRNSWVDPSGPAFAAGTLWGELGCLELGTARSLALQCSPPLGHELCLLCQQELAYRSLALCCVQYNALLLDPQLRQQGVSDVASHGVPGAVFASDPGMAILWKLRETSELSGPQKAERLMAPQQSPPPPQAYTDMSRHRQMFQTPAALLAPALAALRELFFECTGVDVESSADEPQLQENGTMRSLWFQLLGCGCSFALRASCDLAVRIQAVYAASSVRSLASLVPASAALFECAPAGAQQHLQMPFVQRDGLAGGAFVVPSDFDLLQLRGARQVDVLPEMRAALLRRDASLFDIGRSLETPSGAAAGAAGAPWSPSSSPRSPPGAPRSPGNPRSALGAQEGRGGGGRSPGSSKERRRTAISVGPASGGSGDAPPDALVGEEPHLRMAFDSPALAALGTLSELAALVSLRYALAAVSGAPVTLLWLQRSARFRAAGVGLPEEAVGRTDHTAEALAEMCAELARAGSRLGRLGEGAREAGTAEVLRSEVRAAHAPGALAAAAAAAAGARWGAPAARLGLPGGRVPGGARARAHHATQRHGPLRAGAPPAGRRRAPPARPLRAPAAGARRLAGAVRRAGRGLPLRRPAALE
ncbi:unnamed protein product, partial [Prorocentrum cordatum]